MAQWLAEYWWVILLVLVGMLVNGIKALMRIDVSPYIKERQRQDELLQQQLAEREKKSKSQHKQ